MGSGMVVFGMRKEQAKPRFQGPEQSPGGMGAWGLTGVTPSPSPSWGGCSEVCAGEPPGQSEVGSGEGFPIIRSCLPPFT